LGGGTRESGTRKIAERRERNAGSSSNVEEMLGNYLTRDWTKRSFSKTNLRKALDAMPTDDPARSKTDRARLHLGDPDGPPHPLTGLVSHDHARRSR
jgi:hypothetical protein